MPKLIAQSEEFSGKTFDLSGSQLRVGRTTENSIQIEHSSVSSHHAELIQDSGGDYKVRDLDSTNGTRINGDRITEGKLRRNDIVRFGNIELLYSSEFSPAVQMLPDLSPPIDLSICNSTGKPAGFVNTSPFPKRTGKEKSPWRFVILILSILMVGGVGYFVFRLFLNPS